MWKNNPRTLLAFAALLFIVRPVHAGVEFTGVHAVLSSTEPRQVEIYFELRNATPHELELLKLESARADRVDLKRRSYDAENRPRIWPVARFEIPAGGSLRLFHDGPFFLASGLDPKLAAGDHLPLTFTFEDEAPVTLDLTLEATVSASAGSTPAR